MYRPLLALTGLLAASPAQPNILIDNINGVQVTADGTIQRFRALVIGDDGKVVRTVATKDSAEVAAGRRIDMGGRTLLPGLIDAHGHVMGLGFGAIQLDLNGTASLADLQQRLRDYAAANPQARWIVGRGWNQELWPDKAFPSSADLDAVVADRPVVLTRVDGHALIANSAALRAAGVTSATKAPSGGRIENGLFVDNAMPLIEAKIPQPSAADLDAALAKAQELMLSVGLTAVADMGTTPDERAAMDRAGKSGSLNVRIMSYASGIQALPKRPGSWQFDDRLHPVGVKIYADGALGSRGAWLKRPYADKPDTRGLKFLEDAELRDQVYTASARGFQVAVHAIGDAANAQALSVFEAMASKWGASRRWRIEHVQVVDPVDITRLAKAGVIASMQPTHQTSDRLMAEKRLGADRLDGAYAWQTILRSGARLAFGSDFPVEHPNPFPGIAAAVSREDLNGQPPGGWLPHERVSLGQALHGFTLGAAYAGFAEGRIGSLEPGKWADFVIVDRDIVTADAQALARTGVVQTWSAGKKVFERSSASASDGERGR